MAACGRAKKEKNLLGGRTKRWLCDPNCFTKGPVASRLQRTLYLVFDFFQEPSGIIVQDCKMIQTRLDVDMACVQIN